MEFFFWFLQSVDMKRYKYLKYDNGRHLGDKGGCAQPIESHSWTGRFYKVKNKPFFFPLFFSLL